MFCTAYSVIRQLLRHLQTFVHGITSTLIVYYLATYFQGAKENTAIRSGILLFPTACIIGAFDDHNDYTMSLFIVTDYKVIWITIAPAAIIVGRSVEVTGKYLPQTYIGWPLTMIGFGLMSLLTANSSTARGEGLQIILAVGLGFLYVTPQYAVLSPLAVSDNASALALMSWFRTFGQ